MTPYTKISPALFSGLLLFLINTNLPAMLAVNEWFYQTLVLKDILLNKKIYYLGEIKMSKNKLQHVVYECKYHIVLVPKYRYKIFTKDVKIAIKDEIKKLCLWLKVEIIEGNVCADHIHLCCTIPPKYTISEVIGTIKGKSAIRMFNKFPDLKKQYWGSHFWSRGYFVSTVGLNEDIIKQYIKNQDKLDRLENQGKLFK